MDITKQQEIKKWFDENKVKYINFKKFEDDIRKEPYVTLFNKTLHSCMFNDCCYPPIRSHVFQEKGVMKSVSKNSRVYKPFYDDDSHSLILKDVTIGGNSARFWGFCDKHDKIFEEFESRKLLINEKDFTLQIYRCICRELSQIKDVIKANNILYYKIDKQIKKDVSNACLQHISEIAQDNDAILYLDNLVQTAVENCLVPVKQMNVKFERQRDKIYRMYCLMMKRITAKKYSFKDLYKDFYIKHISISNNTLPICVSCFVASINKKSKKLSYNLVLVISFPNGDNQEIIFFSLKSDANYALSFFNKKDMTDNDYIQLLEKITLTNANFWFLNPSYYDSLSDIQRAELNTKISQGVFEHNMNTIGDVFNFEI
ncbi:hypothetical protein HK18_07585 [Commensalibacter intestini]|uniref:Uncharacterized protein n=1 Tax=Commensalibacter intestini TaxID=479936 RepID=A0A251ZVN7_9PROT|nr:hypothetical protein [Commensalibacter intestini]OUI78734.1 hypothetical protein HK18_07585 [Commensalibacter intestini]